MAENYSLWAGSLLHDSAQPHTSAPRYHLGYTQLFSSQSYQMPVDGADRIVSKDSALIAEIAKSSKYDAVVVWLGAVSGGRFGLEGNEEAARKAGADNQPNWDYKNLQNRSALGISKAQGEELGNFGYAVSGYEFGMNLLVEHLGIPETVADPIIRYVLRSGGGFVQVVEDLKNRRFLTVEHNYYGEEVKDVPIVEAGMDYGRFLRFARVAKKYGVDLDPKPFGFDTDPESAAPIFLMGTQLNSNAEAEALQRKVDADIARWMSERAQRHAQELERIRQQRERERENDVKRIREQMQTPKSIGLPPIS